MKKKNSFVIAVMLVIIMSFGGCGGKTDVSVDNTTTEISESDVLVSDSSATVDADLDINVSLEEQEATSDVVSADKTEATEAPAIEQTMEEWLNEMGAQGICLALWNESTGTKRLMMEGEEYTKVEGDRIFLCAPSLITKFRVASVNGIEPERLSENCVEIIFADNKDDDKITVKIITEESEFEINYVLKANENYVATQETQLPGFEWAKKLGYNHPQLVVWNDTTGTKMELEDGATYQLNEGDTVALYKCDHYFLYDANIKMSHIISGNELEILNMKEIEVGDKLELEMTVSHVETFEEITFHITLLPIQ